jgi:hypothetical protein
LDKPQKEVISSSLCFHSNVLGRGVKGEEEREREREREKEEETSG